MTAELAGLHPEHDEDFLLALLNTTPLVDGVRQDALRADGRTWAMRHGGTGTDGELRVLLTTRDALQRVVTGDLPTFHLTPLLAGVSVKPVLAHDAVTWELNCPVNRKTTVRAVLAWSHLQRTAPGRLKPCGNHHCALFLLDRSRAGTARWCSMAVCGNRMKSRRHQQRTRA